MSFLSAAFLFALPLAAAPVALHLLRRRRQEVIRWGAMQFLTDAASDGRRFDQIEEWLLLTLRTLAVLALILALAQPLVRPWMGGTAVAHETVLIIDDSLSTDRREGSERAFDAVRDAALATVASFSPGESVLVILAAEGPRWLTDTPISADNNGKRQLRELIEKLEPTAGAADFLTCFQVAATREPDAVGIDRAVVVIADDRRHGWGVDSPGAWARLRATMERGDQQVTTRVVAVDTRPAIEANLAVAAVTTTARIASVGEPMPCRAEIRNTGFAPSEATQVKWSAAANDSGLTKLPPIAPGATQTVEWRFVPPTAGVYEVTAEIESADLILLDNQNGVVVEAIDAVPVLVVTADEDPDDQQRTFLAAALGASDREENPREDADWISPFRPTFVSPSELSEQRLSDYRVVMIAGVGEIDTAAIDRLEPYVRRGGGLWLLLGSRIDRDAFNERWRRVGAGLCPAKLVGLTRPDSPEDPDATIHPPEGDHPATASLADTERLDIDRVRIHRRHSFSTAERLTPLLETGRGAPLALLNPFGRGRVIVQAFPLRTDWSDLVIAKSFVVLVQDWLAYLSQPSATRFNLRPREAIEFSAPANGLADEATFSLPDGRTRKVAISRVGDQSTYRFAATRLPGAYQLAYTSDSDQNTVVPFRVARDVSESDLQPLNDRDRSNLTTAGGFRFVTDVSAASPAPVSTRPRLDPAWQPLLFALVALLAGELLLATRLSRARYGQAA